MHPLHPEVHDCGSSPRHCSLPPHAWSPFASSAFWWDSGVRRSRLCPDHKRQSSRRTSGEVRGPGFWSVFDNRRSSSKKNLQKRKLSMNLYTLLDQVRLTPAERQMLCDALNAEQRESSIEGQRSHSQDSQHDQATNNKDVHAPPQARKRQIVSTSTASAESVTKIPPSIKLHDNHHSPFLDIFNLNDTIRLWHSMEDEKK